MLQFWLESVSDAEIKELLLADSLLFDKGESEG